MAKMKPKGEGHKVYTFNQDYPLGGKKKGDEISFATVPRHLVEYFDETKSGKGKAAKQLIGEFPDLEKAKKEDMLKFLHDNGVAESETKGLSKEDLLPLFGPFYKS